jgi:hypothetical protein
VGEAIPVARSTQIVQNKKKGISATLATLSLGGGALTVLAAVLLAQATQGSSVNSGDKVTMHPVAARDLAAALETITPEHREAVKAKATSCEQPLAQMAVQGIPGASTPPSGTVQIKSGNYVSPRFMVSDKPVYFAIPYPAPNAPDADQIEIIGQATSVRVSMTPSRDFPLVAGSAFQRVWWEPASSCQPGKG